jgi:hypothetical protein
MEQAQESKKARKQESKKARKQESKKARKNSEDFAQWSKSETTILASPR